MDSNAMIAPRSRFAGKARAVGLLAAGVVAGGVLAGAGIASAATSGATATPTASTATSGTTTTDPAGTKDGGGAASVRGDEKLVTGSDLTTLSAAALKAVPGGTIIRVETDAGDGAYEAHMTKADGTRVTVKFDKNLAVTSVEDGMGHGDPVPAGVTSTTPAA